MGSNRNGDKDNMGKGRPVVWYRGEGAGGPRAEKGGGRRMGRDVGMREV